MNLLLDPDVLAAAANSRSCTEALTDVRQNDTKVLFVIDQKPGLLEKAYTDFLAQNVMKRLKDDNVTIALQIANYILKHPRLLTILPAIWPSEVDDCITQNCGNQIEQQMLKLAVRQCFTKTNPGLVMLLTGMLERSEKRGLHNADVRTSVTAELPGLDIVFANSGKFVHKYHKDFQQIIEQQHSHILQLHTRSWLTRKFSCVPQEPYTIQNEQIDVWGHQANSTVFYVGECKLRFGGEGKKLNDKVVVQQLKRKLAAVHKAKGPNIDVYGLIISNSGLDESVKSEVEALILEFTWVKSIQFFKVKMPKGWEQQTQWELYDSYFEEIHL